jgi:hypothetical protein
MPSKTAIAPMEWDVVGCGDVHTHTHTHTHTGRVGMGSVDCVWWQTDCCVCRRPFTAAQESLCFQYALEVTCGSVSTPCMPWFSCDGCHDFISDHTGADGDVWRVTTDTDLSDTPLCRMHGPSDLHTLLAAINEPRHKFHVGPQRGPMMASFVILPGGVVLTSTSLVPGGSKRLQSPYPWLLTPWGSAFAPIPTPPLFDDDLFIRDNTSDPMPQFQ